MKKVIGYVLAGVGLVGLFASVVPAIGDFIFGKLPAGLADGLGVSLLVISLIVLGAGVVILYITTAGNSHGKQKSHEVPIYKGKEIVGYRRSD